MKFDISEEGWNRARLALLAVPSLSDWVVHLLSMSWNDVPRALDIPEVHDGVLVESTMITESYLRFLDEQIQLNARGDEWSSVLRTRYAAMEPYVERVLLEVAISCPKGFFLAFLNPETFGLVHWEIDEYADPAKPDNRVE